MTTHTEGSSVPIEISEEFFRDFATLSESAKDELVAFLRDLQSNPFSTNVMDKSEKSGKFFASRIGSMVVYWRPVLQATNSLLGQPERLHLLGVRSADDHP